MVDFLIFTTLSHRTPHLRKSYSLRTMEKLGRMLTCH